jgi:hypothetical protein
MGNRSIFRYVVPVDDRWHTYDLTGPIVHVAARIVDEVEFWVVHDPDLPAVPHAFCVFGTGQPMPPAAAVHVGTALAPGGGLVWHLMEHEQVSEVTNA